MRSHDCHWINHTLNHTISWHLVNWDYTFTDALVIGDGAVDNAYCLWEGKYQFFGRSKVSLVINRKFTEENFHMEFHREDNEHWDGWYSQTTFL